MKNKILNTILNLCILININDGQTRHWIYEQFYFFKCVGSSKIVETILPKIKELFKLHGNYIMCVCVCLLLFTLGYTTKK